MKRLSQSEMSDAPDQDDFSPADVTALLKDVGGGNRAAVEKVLPLLYQELRRIARSQLGRGGPAQTLEPTALVHEAFMRLVDQRVMAWQNRGHFLGIAAQLMRRIAVDHARARKAAKRGGGEGRVTLMTNIPDKAQDDAPDVLALDTALSALAKASARQAKIVELRYFGGLSLEETAAALDISPATVKREWTVARAFLSRELRSED